MGNRVDNRHVATARMMCSGRAEIITVVPRGSAHNFERNVKSVDTYCEERDKPGEFDAFKPY